MIIVPFLPESPWYLARCHRDVAARQSLMRLYKNVPNWDLETEYAVLQAEIAHAERLREESRAAKWIEIFQGSNGRRTLASITGPAMQQLVGVPIFFTYLTCEYSLGAAYLWLRSSSYVGRLRSIRFLCSIGDQRPFPSFRHPIVGHP